MCQAHGRGWFSSQPGRYLWAGDASGHVAMREDGFIGVARGARATPNVTESESFTMRNPTRNARGGVDRMFHGLCHVRPA